MKLKVSLEYSDKTSCFELKLFQNEPKKLSLGNTTIKQKICHCICIRRISSSNDFRFGHKFTAVQLKICPIPANGWIWTSRLYLRVNFNKNANFWCDIFCLPLMSQDWQLGRITRCFEGTPPCTWCSTHCTNGWPPQQQLELLHCSNRPGRTSSSSFNTDATHSQEPLRRVSPLITMCAHFPTNACVDHSRLHAGCEIVFTCICEWVEVYDSMQSTDGSPPGSEHHHTGALRHHIGAVHHHTGAVHHDTGAHHSAQLSPLQF